MKIKYFLGSLLSLIISVSAFAQNSPGADYLSLGETKLAKEYFTRNMAQNPEESHYYLGEIAYAEGNMTEAKSQFEQGLAAKVESPLNRIGLAKLQFKSNPKIAEDELKEVQKKNKKDVTVLLAVAKAFFDNGMKEKAQERVDDAKKADKKNPYVYIFEGDMYAAEKKTGDAAMQYDQAINFDPNCALAYMKGARVYEYINVNTATEMLRKAVEIRPDYAIAHKNLADMYYRDGKYGSAIESYKNFFAQGDYTIDDIRRYASAEFFTKNYPEAKKILSQGLTREPNNFVFNRLSMYIENDTQNYDAALSVVDKFFDLPRQKGDSLIVQDYKIAANVLSETGNKERAIGMYKKAVELEPDNAALYKEIASICENEKMYDGAAEFYEKYIDIRGESTDAQDYWQLGYYNYLAGSAAATDTLSMSPQQAKAKSVEFLNKADKSFGTVMERMPDSYLGAFWRARANAFLDPDIIDGLAKPYYEATLNTITSQNDERTSAITSALKESYRYLMFYYYKQYVDKGQNAADKASMKDFSEKLLELDPANNTAQQILDYANQ